MSERDDNVHKAKIAEKLNRFEDMVEAIKVVENFDLELSIEEHNLLRIAYKSVIGSRQSALRKLIILEEDKSENSTSYLTQLQVYRLKIEKELRDICDDMLRILDKHIIQYASTIPAKVFFIKLKGDYHRYLAEFVRDEQKAISTKNSLAAYEEARKIATLKLAPSHPARLSVALNSGVFYSEILNSPEQAYRVSKIAYDEATIDLRSFSMGECSKDTRLYMRTLRNNILLWSPYNDENESEPQISQCTQSPFVIEIWPSKDKQRSEAINNDDQNKLLMDPENVIIIEDDMESENINLDETQTRNLAIEDGNNTNMDISEESHTQNNNNIITTSEIEVENIGDMDSTLDLNMLNAGDQPLN